MKFNFPLNNFAAGEWSPKMKARTDTEQYQRACEELTNMVVQMQGGAAFRAGTERVDVLDPNTDDLQDMLDADAAVKFIPYIHSDPTKSTVLAVRSDDGADYATDGLKGWYMLPSGEKPEEDTRKEFTFDWDPMFIDYTQVGDVLIIVDKLGIKPPLIFHWFESSVPLASRYKLTSLRDFGGTRLGDSTKLPYYWLRLPYSEIQALGSSVTITASATTGTITLTASASFFYSEHADLDSGGTYVKLCDGTSAAGYALITAYTSSTVVTALVLSTLPGTSAIGGTGNPDSFWQMGSWNPLEGQPRSVATYQGRLIFGGSASRPDTIWGSRISNYFMFDEVPGPNTTGPFGFTDGAYLNDNSRPFTLTPNSAIASNIVGMSSAKTLVINTDRTEIIAYGAQGALGPNDVVFESSSSFGSEKIQPVRVNNYLTFVQKGGRKVRDLIFNFQEDQFKAQDLGFVADHLFWDQEEFASDPIIDAVKTENTSSILWCLTQSGKLYGLTLDRDYQVNAWFRVTFGGPEDDTKQLISMCPFYLDGDTDQTETLHLGFKRVIDGNTVFSYEVMKLPWELGNRANYEAIADENFPWYLDCAYTASNGSPQLTWTLPSFYDGLDVWVVADGNDVGEHTVTSNDITLDNAASHILVGFKYQGVLKTMPIEAGGQIGTPMGRQKRIDEMVIRFYNSCGAKFGKSMDGLDEIPFREQDQPMDEAPDFFTGDKVVNFQAGYERAAQVIIVQDSPYPCFVTAVVPRGNTYD